MSRAVLITTQVLRRVLPVRTRKSDSNFTSCPASMTGVHIEPHPGQGVIAVATNGIILASVYDPQGSAHQACDCSITPSLEQLMRQRPDQICFSGEHAWGLPAGVTSVDRPHNTDILFAPAIESATSKFPDWKSHIPTAIAPSCNGITLFDATLLERLLSGFEKSERTQAHIYCSADTEAPYLVRLRGHAEFFGVIMPLGLADASWDTRLPTWFEAAPHA